MKKVLIFLTIFFSFYSVSILAEDVFGSISINAEASDRNGVFDSIDLSDNVQSLKKGKLIVLNKITAHSKELNMYLNQKIYFGQIEVEMHSCLASQNKGSFLFVSLSEKNLEEKKLIFRGWLSAKSPSLSAVEHPVYQVIAISCV